MWKLANKMLSSRLLLGTARYPALAVMQEAIQASQTQIITVAIKRLALQEKSGQEFWSILKTLNCHLLPNTAGCHTAQDAMTAAEMARELFQTNWIKLEVIGDTYNLQPDSFELVKAAKGLIDRGFEVFPYCTDDLVICRRLIDVGCQILMPWASPIGSGKGLLNVYALETLRQRLPDNTLIIDAGIGKPSQAVHAMELGYDAILLNTAVAAATHPVQMAKAFRDAIIAGRTAFEAGLLSEKKTAQPSTALSETPFWPQRSAL